MKYAVQLNTICDGWINVWTDNDQEPVLFDTHQEAEQELRDYLDSAQAAFENGDIDTPYPFEDYRIVEVNHG